MTDKAMTETTGQLYDVFGRAGKSRGWDLLSQADECGEIAACVEALVVFGELKDVGGRVAALILCGLICERKAHYAGKEHYYFEQARNVLRQSTGARGEALCCLVIARLSNSVGLGYAHLANDLYCQSFDSKGQGRACFLIGERLLQQQERLEAKNYLNESIRFLRRAQKVTREIGWCNQYLNLIDVRKFLACRQSSLSGPLDHRRPDAVDFDSWSCRHSQSPVTDQSATSM